MSAKNVRHFVRRCRQHRRRFHFCPFGWLARGFFPRRRTFPSYTADSSTTMACRTIVAAIPIYDQHSATYKAIGYKHLPVSNDNVSSRLSCSRNYVCGPSAHRGRRSTKRAVLQIVGSSQFRVVIAVLFKAATPQQSDSVLYKNSVFLQTLSIKKRVIITRESNEPSIALLKKRFLVSHSIIPSNST